MTLLLSEDANFEEKHRQKAVNNNGGGGKVKRGKMSNRNLQHFSMTLMSFWQVCLLISVLDDFFGITKQNHDCISGKNSFLS